MTLDLGRSRERSSHRNQNRQRRRGKLHCSSLKIKRLQIIRTFAPRNVPCRNGDCRSDVARRSRRSILPHALRFPCQRQAVSTRSSSKMHRTTGNEAYREEALEFVRAYQKVFPYWPWTYSLDALLEKDAATRSLAACRARYLDPGVRFPEARWPDAHGGFFCLQRRALEVNQVTAALDRWFTASADRSHRCWAACGSKRHRGPGRR